MEEDVKVYVCFHDVNKFKDIQKNIKNDKMYVPLFLRNNRNVGQEFLSDADGENISDMNPYFSELTGIYWMSKNTDTKIVGLCHYRRYFINHKYGGRLLKKEEIIDFLKDNDIILTPGIKPLKGTNYESYPNLHQSLDMTYEILKKDYPNYVDSFNEVIHSEYPISYFNMFICQKEIIDDYCEWMFPILFELFENIDVSYDPRILSFTSEMLFNVYINYKNLKIKEVPLRFTEIKIKLKMFFTKIEFNRILYKNVYFPLISKIK